MTLVVVHKDFIGNHTELTRLLDAIESTELIQSEYIDSITDLSAQKCGELKAETLIIVSGQGSGFSSTFCDLLRDIKMSGINVIIVANFTDGIPQAYISKNIAHAILDQFVSIFVILSLLLYPENVLKYSRVSCGIERFVSSLLNTEIVGDNTNISRLSEQELYCFLMREILGIMPQEIAQEGKVNVASFGSYMRRAKKKLGVGKNVSNEIRQQVLNELLQRYRSLLQ